MDIREVKQWDTIQNPATLDEYRVILTTPELIVAQRTIAIGPETPYLVHRNGSFVPIVFSDLRVGDQVSFDSKNDAHTVVSNEPNCSHAIAVNVRVLPREIAIDWISEE